MINQRCRSIEIIVDCGLLSWIYVNPLNMCHHINVYQWQIFIIMSVISVILPVISVISVICSKITDNMSIISVILPILQVIVFPQKKQNMKKIHFQMTLQICNIFELHKK